MTIKHLPGKHNQKLHSSKKKLSVFTNKRAYKPSLGIFGARPPILPRPDVPMPEDGDRPSINYVRNQLHNKYSKDNDYSMLNDGERLDARGFRATLTNLYGTDTIRTNIFDVTDPEETEKFIHDFIEESKNGQFKEAVFHGLPIDIAEQLNGTYTASDDELGELGSGGLIYLNKKYDVSIPKEFIIRSAFDGADLVDAAKVKRWLKSPMSGLESTPHYSLSGYSIIPVASLHNVKHPSHPELPLITEYLAEEGHFFEQVVHVNLRPTP